MPSFLKLGIISSILWTTISAEVIINHDEVMPFSEAYRPDHDVLLKFKPFVGFIDGCVAFPAVNAAGEVSGGLKPTGDAYECSPYRTEGQMYARIGFIGKHMGLMYGWYFPKDQGLFAKGLRHEWQFVVVWLNSLFDQTAIHLSYTTRGEWREDAHWDSLGHRPIVGIRFQEITTSPELGGYWPHPVTSESDQVLAKRGVDGSGVKAAGRRVPVVIGAPGYVNTPVRQTNAPMIDWDLLTDSAKLALNVHSWGTRGDQQMFMNDKNFQPSLAAAYFKAFRVSPTE